MHNQRQAALVGGFDVGDKAAVLPVQIALAPVVIQPGFADAHHFGVLGVCHQLGGGKFSGVLLVGMYAHGGVDVAVCFGQGQHFGKGIAAHADGQRLAHIGGGHIGQHFRQPVDQIGKIKVAV